MKQSLHEDAYQLKVFKKGSGPAVVMLHGQVSTHRYMADITKRLTSHRTVYAFDLLGFGRSPRPKQAAYTVDQHVRSIHKTLLAQDVKPPIVFVGHSMGSQLALAYATKYPEMVGASVLTGLPLFESTEKAYDQLTALSPKNAWLLRGRRARILGAMPAFTKPMLACIALVFSRGEYPVRVVIDVVRNNWQSFSRSLQEVVIAYDPYPDIRTSIQTIHFIYGNKDTIAVHPEQKLKKFIGKKHHIQIVPGTHHVPLEHPKVIADKVLSL